MALNGQKGLVANDLGARSVILTHIVIVDPLVANLEIVILNDHLDEPVEQVLAFPLCHVVDVRNVTSHGEDALPSGDGIRADDWMYRFKRVANIVGRSSLARIQLEAMSHRASCVPGLGVHRGQRF
jgi:hypothetical protein